MASKRGADEGFSFKKTSMFKGIDRDNYSLKDNSSNKTQQWVHVTTRKSVKSRDNLQLFKPCGRDSTVEMMRDRGKIVMVRNSKRKTSNHHILNEKLVLEKKGIVKSRVDSSTDSEIESGLILNLGKFKGESSKLKLMDKMPIDHSKARSGSSSSSDGLGEITGKDFVEVSLEVDLIGSVGRTRQKSEGHLRRKTQIDTGRDDNRNNTESSVQILERKKVRELLKKSYWNLEKELAKLIEKRLPRGYVFNSRHKESELEKHPRQIGDQ
ncbi:hypothetical protein QYF36_013426 [Acer negundo]|nr:hypothetical protein QYF36_013426 [Acer negundo]